MEDQQRVRLIILAISGLLFGAGYYGYTWYQDQKAATEAENEPVVTMRPARKKPIETASTTTLTATAPGTTPVKTAVSLTKAAGEGGATVVAANNETPITKPVAIPVKTVATAPVTAQPTPIAEAPTKPVVQPQPVQPAQPAQPAPPVAKAPVKPTVTPVVAANPTQPITALPASNTAPKVTTPITTTPLAAAPTGDGKHYPATTQSDAISRAQANKGRPDPVEPALVYKPWPRNARKDATGGANDAVLAMVPPPPPHEKDAKKPFKPQPIKEKLVPPPPPTQATPTSGGDALAGLPIDQLPAPPSRPTIGDKVKVLGVLDDKAIISFPKSMLHKNHWPRTITLGQGEQFESLTVVSINRDGVTIEEDGERTLKPIATIK